ncbi:MAG: hypothetical protein HY257_12150 [Chloroflexi bacterium]|nr:hypothetical protein [Chloroflexota bacterium]
MKKIFALFMCAMIIVGCAPAAPAPVSTIAPAATSAPTPLVATQPAPKASGVQVDIKLFQYQPNPIEIKVGTMVTWTNQDNIQHSVTNGTPPTPGKEFDSGLFDQGKTFSFTFTKAGNYPYFCVRHNSLVGIVKVNP